MENFSLNVSDIADAIKVIDFAADQGAYKGWDNIRLILALRDKLASFVQAAGAAAAKDSEAVARETEVNTEAQPVLAEGGV